MSNYSKMSIQLLLVIALALPVDMKPDECVDFPCPDDQICIVNPLPQCVPIERAPTCLDIGCDDPENFTCVQDKINNNCLNPDCPKAEPVCVPNKLLNCEPFAEFWNCGVACEPSCNDLSPTCNIPCFPNVCRCIPGYVRDANNRCLAIRECPPGPPGPSTKVPRSCNELRCPAGESCFQEKCETANCIQPPPICFPNEPFMRCPGWWCPEGQVCQQQEVICLKPNCLQPTPKCVLEGSPSDPCSLLLCPYGTKCKEVKQKCCNKPCPRVAKCVETGKTVCFKHERWNSCTLTKSNCPLETQFESCVARCECVHPYLRFGDKCVKPDQCPKG